VTGAGVERVVAMNAELTVLQGSTAGVRFPLSSANIVLGRNPDADLLFDPLQDLTVSGTHAEVTRTVAGWMIRDMESLNGTWVNGEKISSPVLLQDQDRIQLGTDGPLVEFRLMSHAEGTSAIKDGKSSGRRRGTRRLWTTVVVLSLTLFGVGLLALQSRREGLLYKAQAQAMHERIDSILDASAATADGLQGRIQGLGDALAESRETLQNVRRDLESSQQAGDSDEIAFLRVELQEAQAAVVRQQLAATLDFDGIEAANRRAIAKVFVDFGDGALTATAFSVRPDGTLLTNRHVVGGPSGTRTPLRLAVQFADSRQVWPARVLASSSTDDIAVLKVDNIVGEVPTILGFNQRPDTIQSGQGIAILGFPLGGAAPTGEGSNNIARTTLTAGIISANGDDFLEVNGYGVEGSSGSPLFDDGGEVVAVLFGGTIEGGERTLFAVPANRAAAFLNQTLRAGSGPPTR
jgi:S1-C subfamily serine protease